MPSSPEPGGYHGTCGNLYEDVETISGYLSGHNSWTLKEHKAGPKSKKRLNSYLVWSISHYEMITIGHFLQIPTLTAMKW